MAPWEHVDGRRRGAGSNRRGAVKRRVSARRRLLEPSRSTCIVMALYSYGPIWLSPYIVMAIHSYGAVLWRCVMALYSYRPVFWYLPDRPRGLRRFPCRPWSPRSRGKNKKKKKRYEPFSYTGTVLRAADNSTIEGAVVKLQARD